jgi:hypothetical protein
MSGAPSGGRRRFDLREREPSVIEKGAPRGGQFNAVHAAVHQRNADLVSRSRIWRLSDGCAVCSLFSAATVRLPASATATK